MSRINQFHKSLYEFSTLMSQPPFRIHTSPSVSSCNAPLTSLCYKTQRRISGIIMANKINSQPVWDHTHLALGGSNTCQLCTWFSLLPCWHRWARCGPTHDTCMTFKSNFKICFDKHSKSDALTRSPIARCPSRSPLPRHITMYVNKALFSHIYKAYSTASYISGRGEHALPVKLKQEEYFWMFLWVDDTNLATVTNAIWFTVLLAKLTWSS